MEELVRRSNPSDPLTHDCLARLIQHAVSIRVLSEPRQGHVAHSVSSHLLATSAPMMDWIGSFSEDIWPAAPRMVDALSKWPGEPLPTQTGHNLAEGTSAPFFQTLASKPDRARRFASAMSIMQSAPGWDPSAALSGFDWGSLSLPRSDKGGTVVDVGGSDGTFGRALCRQHPSLKVIVQDLPSVIQSALANPKQDCDSLILQEHDFFTEQPVHGADAYVLRMVLHDWPDAAATKILRQLAPALKPGARILINDHCVPPADSMSLLQKRLVRQVIMTGYAISGLIISHCDDVLTVFMEQASRFDHDGGFSRERANTGAMDSTYNPSGSKTSSCLRHSSRKWPVGTDRSCVAARYRRKQKSAVAGNAVVTSFCSLVDIGVGDSYHQTSHLMPEVLVQSFLFRWCNDGTSHCLIISTSNVPKTLCAINSAS